MSELLLEIWEALRPWLVDTVFGEGGLLSVLVAAILGSAWMGARHWLIRKLAAYAAPKVQEYGQVLGDSIKQHNRKGKMPPRTGANLQGKVVEELRPAVQELPKPLRIITTDGVLKKAVNRAVAERNKERGMRSKDIKARRKANLSKPGTKGGR